MKTTEVLSRSFVNVDRDHIEEEIRKLHEAEKAYLRGKMLLIELAKQVAGGSPMTKSEIVRTISFGEDGRVDVRWEYRIGGKGQA